MTEDMRTLDVLHTSIIERINEVTAHDKKKSTLSSSAEMRVHNACRKTFLSITRSSTHCLEGISCLGYLPLQV